MITNQQPEQWVKFAWSIEDGDYTYMDIWMLPAQEWQSLTPAMIEARQMQQYNAWRAYLQNPGA